jgi:PAS domain S-box-containing protein
MNKQGQNSMSFLESNSGVWGKKVSREVLKPRDVLETLLANSSDAVLSVDATGRVLALNKAAEVFYEVSPQQVVGQSLGTEVCLLQPHLTMLNELIQHAVKNSDVLVDKDIAITQSDGEQKHFNIRTSLLAAIDGQSHPQLILVLSDITEKVKAARERSESTMFLAAIITVLLISKSIDNWVLINAGTLDIYSNTFVWAYTVAVCAPMVAYLWWLNKPLSEFGVTLKNWKQSLVESGMVTGVLLFFGALALFGFSMKEGVSLVSYINSDWLKLETLAYIPHSIIQEFIFRGVVLTIFLQLFRDHSVWLPLLISNLLFSFMHMHLGVAAMVLTLLMGYLFSWMYLRHKSILGISVAHIILGSSAFAFSLL